MTKQAKAAAKPKGKAAAAASEVKDEPITVEIRGVEVVLPSKLPSDFALRYAKISARMERGLDASGALYELIVGVIGEDVYDAIADKLASNGDEPLGLFEFVGEISSPYYVSPGESPASAES